MRLLLLIAMALLLGAGTTATAREATPLAQAVAARRAERLASARAELKSGVITVGGARMPIWFTIRGQAPAGGRSRWISLHGGGSALPEVNDQQWRNQQRLYAPEEGVYVAPRGPTDTWDLWHQAHMDPLIDRLIEDMVLVHGVNPDRVYLMGHSAGGDGVYQLGTRMADRFAAASDPGGYPHQVTIYPQHGHWMRRGVIPVRR